MNIYRELPASLGPTVATIGNFDGVHLGHQWVIAEVVARARELARALGGATDLLGPAIAQLQESEVQMVIRDVFGLQESASASVANCLSLH